MLNKLIQYIRWFESGVLVVLFLLLLSLAVVQVLLRNVFDTGILWGDELVRMAVLWITMVGAMVAVDQRSHIRIDIVERFSSERIARITRSVANVIAAAVCFLFAYHSIEFVRDEYLFPMMSVGIIPSWALVTIFPISGFVMGLRFSLQAFERKKT